jgi:ectoine hydroxylase-related dioxygenase (phytanoyl-CoA dioxygenase family)
MLKEDKEYLNSHIPTTILQPLSQNIIMPASTHSDTQDVSSTSLPAHLYSLDESPSLSEFQKLCSQDTLTQQYPLSTVVSSNIPIYDLSTFSLQDNITTSLQKEWHHILLSGPGVFILRKMFDPSIIETVNHAFQKIIDAEKKTSSNLRSNKDWLWNIFSKHCLSDPQSFYAYYSNPWLSLVSTTWLGPNYQLTAQVNNVHPGGEAQHPHRDYHLGFLPPERLAQVPIVTQIASQLLTLQGAVAHSGMPAGTGATRLLPFSQQFKEGFLAFKRPEFKEFFAKNYISLELDIGDGIFFNPALYHAAGANESKDFVRKAVLLQISSAYGRPMEMVECLPLIERSWDVLKERYDGEGLSLGVKSFIQAVAKGYCFPTNLDRASVGPVELESEQQVILKALSEGWDKERVFEVLKRMTDDCRA